MIVEELMFGVEDLTSVAAKCTQCGTEIIIGTTSPNYQIPNACPICQLQAFRFGASDSSPLHDYIRALTKLKDSKDWSYRFRVGKP